MAVADVAVAIGPRNRRRLTAGAIGGLAVIGAVAAVVLLTSSPSPSGPAATAARPSRAGSTSSTPAVGRCVVNLAAQCSNLVFGMTAQQVRRIAGRPDKIIRTPGNTCWQYNVNQKFPAMGPFRPYTINAVQVCFFAGRYSISHRQWNGTWDPPPPSAP